MSDAINYSAMGSDEKGQPIVAGLSWDTRLDVISDDDWQTSDEENPDNFKFLFHPVRLGGTPAITISPVSATIDPTNAKILTLVLEMDAVDTVKAVIGDVQSQIWYVDVQHKVGEKWFDRTPMSGTVIIRKHAGE